MGKGKGYCKLSVDLNSAIKLKKLLNPCLKDGAKLIEDKKMHCTVMYDLRNPEIDVKNNKNNYVCKVTGVKTLGKKGTKWYAAVLELESPEIKQRFNELLEMGFKHSFPDLIVHVSISYGENTDKVFPELKTLFEEGKLPKTITLCNEEWEFLED